MDRPRDILGSKLVLLMSANAELDTIQKLSARSGVSKGVVERMIKAEVNTGIDHLAGIAKAFGLPISELLTPTSTSVLPRQMTELNGIEGQLITMFRALDPEEQDVLLTDVNHVYKRHLPGPSPADPFAGRTPGDSQPAPLEAPRPPGSPRQYGKRSLMGALLPAKKRRTDDTEQGGA